MYYPYLRAKQYELKALRELADEGGFEGKITPILQPVKEDVRLLKNAIEEMKAKGMKFALILNPTEGDFKRPGHDFHPFEELDILNNDRHAWIPAFLFNGENDIRNIKETIERNMLKDVMLVFKDGMDVENEDIWALINQPEIGTIVYNLRRNGGRILKHRIKESAKKLITLLDAFNHQPLSLNYSDKVDELFTEEPFFYEEEDFDGFGDYATLSANYSEGGGMPRALVIHLTYLKNKNQIFVHHFLSDSILQQEDIRMKFREAALKVEKFYHQNNIRKTRAVSEIINKAHSGNGYPGLGGLKKLSLKNHFQLILSLN